MKSLLKVVSVTGGLLLASSGISGTAGATGSVGTTCTNQGPIISGLREGVDIATGSDHSCNPAASSSGGNKNVPTTQPANGTQRRPNMTGSAPYVALGDSVAAGLGLPMQSGGNQRCRVSYQAYPAYVAAALGVPYTNVACSGATVGDLVTEQHLSNTSADIAPQLDAAFAGGTPSVMTLTAGANDMYWQYFLRKCFTGTCGTGTDQAAATQLLRVLQLKLNYALQSVARRSNGATPMVVITGYYRPFAANCPAQSSLTAAEMQWLNTQTDALNAALAGTARNFSFAHFVPVQFNGHELCTNDPWIQGQNDTAPAHPTARGQQAIAQAVVSYLQARPTSSRSGY